MTVDEFIGRYYNDSEYKETLQSELLNLKSAFSKKELQEHREHIKQLVSSIEFNNLIDKIESYSLLDEFIYRANIVHNNRYDYPSVNYTKCDESINIICSMHGLFSQEANSHLQGHGCPRCASQKTLYLSNYTKYKNKKTTLYYIKISESYWKLGLTKQSVEKRFRKELANGLKIEILFTEEFEDGWEAYLIEQDALLESIEYRIQKYDSPILGGWTEIRNVDFINKIKIKD